MADWLGISSAHIDSLCGEGANTLADALDAVDFWRHDDVEVHWFILDLGATYTITKVRGRSIKIKDPIDVDIYVSDDKENWGAAVASGIATFQDTEVWQEVDTDGKDGRYIKVVVNGTEAGTPAAIEWGKQGGGISIFDAYGSVLAVAAGGAGAAAELLLAGQV